jgi:hypothetical protein
MQLATINHPELLPYGAFAAADSFVIHDRRYQPLVRLAAHEDQDEPCEGWGNADLPGGIECLNRGGWPAFIRVRPETARIADPSERIPHDKDDAVWFYRGEPDHARLQDLVNSIPELGAEIQRRDAAVSVSEKIEADNRDFHDRLNANYHARIDHKCEIRERMSALRQEKWAGWEPSAETIKGLNDLNERIDLYAAKHMDTARDILSFAEADNAASRPHRLARIERARERVRALERAYEAGWRPNAGKKWPDPEVVMWCGLLGKWFDPLDEIESIIAQFENKHAQYVTFAEDMRAGRIPGPTAPEDPAPKFKLNLGPTLLGRKRK